MCTTFIWSRLRPPEPPPLQTGDMSSAAYTSARQAPRTSTVLSQTATDAQLSRENRAMRSSTLLLNWMTILWSYAAKHSNIARQCCIKFDVFWQCDVLYNSFLCSWMDETSYCVLQPISEYRSERITKKSNRLTLDRITTKRLCGCFTLDRSVGGCRVGRNSYLRRSFRPSVRLSVSPFVCLSVFRRVSQPCNTS